MAQGTNKEGSGRLSSVYGIYLPSSLSGSFGRGPNIDSFLCLVGERWLFLYSREHVWGYEGVSVSSKTIWKVYHRCTAESKYVTKLYRAVFVSVE